MFRSPILSVTLTLPYTGDTIEAWPNSPYASDRLDVAMCEARCHMFNSNMDSPSDVDNVTRKWLGAREDLLEPWKGIAIRVDGVVLGMEVLL
jgi:hypothetical protein